MTIALRRCTSMSGQGSGCRFRASVVPPASTWRGAFATDASCSQPAGKVRGQDSDGCEGKREELLNKPFAGRVKDRVRLAQN